jgi:hypothetical protein
MKKMMKAQKGKIVKKAIMTAGEAADKAIRGAGSAGIKAGMKAGYKSGMRKGVGYGAAAAIGTGAAGYGIGRSSGSSKPTSTSKPAAKSTAKSAPKSATWYKEGPYKKAYDESAFKDDIDRNKRPYPKDMDVKRTPKTASKPSTGLMRKGGMMKSKRK